MSIQCFARKAASRALLASGTSAVTLPFKRIKLRSYAALNAAAQHRVHCSFSCLLEHTVSNLLVTVARNKGQN